MSVLRVLLADDHELIRSGLRTLIEASADIIVVGEAINGEETVRMVGELKPHVVVMDLSMPVMDGAAATERIGREFPEVRVLALTAHDDHAHLTRLLHAGAAGYVLKRGAADELVRAIRSVAAGNTYVDPTLAGRLLRRVTRPVGANPSSVTDPLSEREEEVLRLIAWGHSNKEIAEKLAISTKTVETYRARIGEKLGLRSRTDLVRYAVQRGWLADT